MHFAAFPKILLIVRISAMASSCLVLKRAQSCNAYYYRNHMPEAQPKNMLRIWKEADDCARSLYLQGVVFRFLRLRSWFPIHVSNVLSLVGFLSITKKIANCPWRFIGYLLV